MTKEKVRSVRLDINEIFFLAVLCGLSIVFYKIVASFLFTAIIAIVLAYLFKDLYHLLLSKYGGKRSLASLSIVLIILFLITLPLLIAGLMISIEATEGYLYFKKNWATYRENFYPSTFLEPWRDNVLVKEGMAILEKVNLAEKMGQGIEAAVDFLVTTVRKAFLNITILFVHFCLILYLVYFLLADGEKLQKRIFALLPVPKDEGREMLEDVMKTAKATLMGTVIIGIAEGTYGGVLFAFAGIRAPFLWGAVMAIFSMIPLIGTNGILFPMGVYFIVSGQIAWGMIFLILGCGGILVSQNIIRPKLVGDQSGIHPTFIVISTLGGIAWLGLVGFLVGPLVASLFISIWTQFGIRYRKDIQVS